MGRLIIISNRLPFTLDRTDGNITVRQSSGGLVSAIKSYLEREEEAAIHFSGQMWVGTLDAPVEDWNAANESGSLQSDYQIEPVFVEKTAYDAFYNGFSNSTLWPLFHYFPSLVTYKKEYFEAYVAVNQAFADRLVAIAQPGDVLWVHDYQLMALPQMLRERLPEATIGFFLHIPFPSYELFRLLPTAWKRMLLQGVLGADLVGFHTFDYVQHFIQSVKMGLKGDSQFTTIQYRGRLIKADVFPIGIDYKKFREAIRGEAVASVRASLQENYGDMKIIFSVDRLDYSKGLDFRLQGFEDFLDKFPEWRGKVVFILNVIPSRDVIPTYVERKRLIEEKVSTINGRFSTLSWAPVVYRYNHLSFEELCALYKVADVALITPLRDGMNLVAKEFIASCEDKGVLILSELTGAASELNEALQVTPTDTEEVVNALNTALLMPLAEQQGRLAPMQRRLSDYDVIKWINDFLGQLAETKKEQEKQKVEVLGERLVQQIVADYRKASKRCILLDYDGTLSPIVKLPSLAVPSAELLQLLTELSTDNANEVVVISGRDADTLQRWLGHLPLTLVAEHGACIRYKNEDWQYTVASTGEWKNQIRPLLELFVSRCVGSFLEEKKNTLAWHYRNTNPDLGFVRSRELRNSLLQLTANTQLQVIDGNKVIEVRLIGVDKGATASTIFNHYHPDFTLCIGDDTTDEDMFRGLKARGYTIKVGFGSTAAQCSIASQAEVLPLLRRLMGSPLGQCEAAPAVVSLTDGKEI
ncbi:bifunctional alpha,alpha-trehalose-phosphate synthase (UDP-forming)/trehalose-phosphatase [Paraflavisolibacter sp. H34]|uniref:bifunctional alpha,alpha-trehalose-phosphate synthase (UDP-forming)/trehalose-phosphatase n=1 Tax=Huijunlia imazamoxiresistens TaxID=3127457 RepID=UPI00301A8465